MPHRHSSAQASLAHAPITPTARPPERRKPVAAPATDGLTQEQLSTLHTLEQFHWRLQFVRRPLFKAPIPVLMDRAETRHVVIQEDGSLDENPTLVLRR